MLRNPNEKRADLALAELYEQGGIKLPKDFDKARKYGKCQKSCKTYLY